MRKAADLYGLPREEFTRARDELVRELKKAGKKEQAGAVAGLKKPSVSAWVVNQLARRHPEDARRLVRAGEALRKAQRAAVSGRDPSALREAQRAHRDALDALSLLARQELEVEGQTAQRVAQTLRAASVDKEAAKVFLAGTLTGDVEQVGFGPMLGVVPRVSRPRAAPKVAKAKPPSKPKPDPRIKQRAKVEEQLEKARARVHELEARLEELAAPR